MFRSLNVKLVLIFIVFIISVMSVVGVFLLDRVSAFYAEDFLNQMDEGFSERLKETLVGCFDTEKTASAQKEVMTAYSAAFSFDNYRNFYILDMNGNVLEGSSQIGTTITKTPNLLAAMNRKNFVNKVSGSEFFDYACYITNGSDECIIYIFDDLTRMKSLIWVLFSIIMQALFIGLAIAMFLCFFMTRAITSPIQKLTAGAKTIASGQYDYRIETQSKDEIGELTENFNRMAQKIESSMAQVSDEREKLKTIFGHLEDGVAAFDENGKSLHINHSACDILGVATDREYDFDSFTRILGMPEITVSILKSAVTLNIPEYTIKKATGELITDVSFNIFHYDETRIGYIIVIQNITDRALLEKSRREFIANVSHELRTPLTSIKGATEIILTDEQMPENMKKRFLSIVMNESDRMTRIVKDLLVLSRLENRRMSWKLSRFSLHNALSQISAALQTEAAEHGHTLTYTSEVPESEMIAADKERIEQVFTNLIGNAIKYTPNGGIIEISVKDNGIGIPEENIPHLFERFYRVDKARNSDVGGTGLGLSISKEIVDAHHGVISVESRKGEGTKVTVLLPRETAVCEEE